MAVAVNALLAPSPALITKVLGTPAAGLEDVITIWNVFWHTLPLTIAAAIDAGILWWFTKHPGEYPKTDKGKIALWCVLGGIIVASMILGGWLGQVEMSAWSRARVDEVQSVQKRFDPSVRMTVNYGRELIRHKQTAPIAIAVAAFAAIANYFTLYGPSMFFSSLVVGGFLGWIWAIKLPACLADIDKPSSAA